MKIWNFQCKKSHGIGVLCVCMHLSICVLEMLNGHLMKNQTEIFIISYMWIYFYYPLEPEGTIKMQEFLDLKHVRLSQVKI